MRNVLYPAHHGREERIGDVGDDHSQHAGLVAPQAAPELTWLIIQTTNRMQHSFPQFFAHTGSPVDYMRDCADGNTCTFGDFPDCDWRIQSCRRYGEFLLSSLTQMFRKLIDGLGSP